MNKNVLIIGAGLSGLTSAFLLERQGFQCTVLESRARVGGRIHTLYSKDHAPVEMGATWIDLGQKNIIALIKMLDIDLFEQELGKTAVYEQISSSPAQLVQLPPNNNPSFRIKGGTGKLIEGLQAELSNTKIHFSTKCLSISSEDELLKISSSTGDYSASFIINTLPPYLFNNTVEVSPNLPSEVVNVMNQTHTWMGDSIKVSILFRNAFWKEGNLSGTIFSNVGPVTEMYDQSDVNSEFHALTGFLNGAFFNASTSERRNLVVNQLKKYYGEKVEEYLAYEEAVWRNDEHTFIPYNEYVLPKMNNGHEVYQKPYLDGRLFFIGAETSPYAPGHMEAAVESAQRVAKLLGSLDF